MEEKNYSKCNGNNQKQHGCTNYCTNYEEREYHKVPRYSGLKKDWMIWSEKFLTVLERKGMPVLVDQLDSTDDVPKDADECKETKPPHDVIEAKLDYKLQNAKAFAYLFESIDDTTGQGKECWMRIKSHKTAGYKRGNFKTAWLELKALYEKRDLTTMNKIRTAYYDRKLGVQEHPTTFLTDLKDFFKDLTCSPNVFSNFLIRCGCPNQALVPALLNLTSQLR